MHTAAPDWSQRTDEICCPLCEYNLRGLSEPRCPECGYTFDWPTLLDPTKRSHPYLFEHHPERNFWSFIQTILGALRPRRFWVSLHPAQPSRPRRLMLFWMLCTLIALLPAVLLFALICFDYYRLTIRQRQMWAVGYARQPQVPASIVAQEIEQHYPLPPSSRFFLNALHSSRRAAAPASWTVGYVFWPWVTLGGLMIFQITMRRARIRTSHLMRCTIYSADITPVIVAAVLVGIALVLRDHGIAYGAALRLPTAAIAILWLVPTWRLIVACKRYLRIPAPATTVLLTQIIYLLLLAKVALDCFGIDYVYELVQLWAV